MSSVFLNFWRTACHGCSASPPVSRSAAAIFSSFDLCEIFRSSAIALSIHSHCRRDSTSSFCAPLPLLRMPCLKSRHRPSRLPLCIFVCSPLTAAFFFVCTSSRGETLDLPPLPLSNCTSILLEKEGKKGSSTRVELQNHFFETQSSV